MTNEYDSPGAGDDLFQPTLSSDDDRHNFREPWNPNHLLWVAAFGGVLAAGILTMINDNRLGLPSRVKWLVPATLVAWAGLTAAMVLTLGSESFANGDVFSLGREFRLVNRIAALVLIWPTLAAQRQRFGIFQTGDEEPASLWQPAIGAIVVTGIVQYAVFGFLIAVS